MSYCCKLNGHSLPMSVTNWLTLHALRTVHQEVSVVASQSDPLPLPIYLPPLTAAAPGELVAPPGLKMQQLGLASWNLDRLVVLARAALLCIKHTAPSKRF